MRVDFEIVQPTLLGLYQAKRLILDKHNATLYYEGTAYFAQERFGWVQYITVEVTEEGLKNAPQD